MNEISNGNWNFVILFIALYFGFFLFLGSIYGYFIAKRTSLQVTFTIGTLMSLIIASLLEGIPSIDLSIFLDEWFGLVIAQLVGICIGVWIHHLVIRNRK